MESNRYDNFNRILNEIAKTRELPTLNYSFISHSKYGKNYSLKDIKDAQNGLDIQAMREISNFFFDTSPSYKRMINFFSNLFKFYYNLDLKNLKNYYVENDEKNKKLILKLYEKTLTLLDNMNLTSLGPEILEKVFVDGAYYGYLNFFDGDRIVITSLDPNYCRSRYKSAYNTNVLEFDIRFFDKYHNEKDKINALDSMPKIVSDRYALYHEGKITNINDYFVLLPPEESCVFKLDDRGFPVLFDSIIDIINFNDYKDIEKRRDVQDLKKILVQKFNLDEDSDLEMLLDEMANIHQATSQMLKNQENVDLITTIADIHLEDLQTATGTANQNNILKMLLPKYENAGLSSELFSASTSASLETTINNATSFMGKIISDFSNWLSMVCYSYFGYKKMYPVVEILPITWYNQEKMIDVYIKQAQNGYSLLLPYIASGKKQSTLMDNKIMETEILELQKYLVPLQTSYTQSGPMESEEAGRPEKSNTEKTDKTVTNIEAK